VKIRSLDMGLLSVFKAPATRSPIRFSRRSPCNPCWTGWVNIRGVGNANVLRTRNVAAVLVTADLPPFIQPGSRVDVTVSSLGDATSLLGGTLVLTALSGVDGQTYAIAQARLPSLASPCQAKLRALPKMWQQPGGFQMAP